MCDACGKEEQEIDAALAAAEAELRARGTPPPDGTAAGRRCGDHRPGLGRDWCHMDGEWCYQDDPCRGCTIVILQARLTALAALVRRMRAAQRVYFKTRDRGVMVEAKTLEREVDRALALP